MKIVLRTWFGLLNLDGMLTTRIFTGLISTTTTTTTGKAAQTGPAKPYQIVPRNTSATRKPGTSQQSQTFPPGSSPSTAHEDSTLGDQSPPAGSDAPHKKKKTHRGKRSGRKVKSGSAPPEYETATPRVDGITTVTDEADEKVLKIGDGEWEVVVRKAAVGTGK